MWAGLAAFLILGIMGTRFDGLMLSDVPFGPRISGLPAGRIVAAVPVSVAEASALPHPLRIATEGAFPPFNFIDETGALRGLEVDLVHDLCANLGATCEVTPHPWPSLLAGLRQGRYDVVAASLRVPAHLPDGIAFTEPYFPTAAVFVARLPEAGSLGGPDFAGRTIAVQQDTRLEAWLAARHPDAVIQPHANAVEAYRALAEGKADLVFDDAVRVSRWLDAPAGTCCAALPDVVVAPEILGSGVAFAVRAEDTRLRGVLNNAIARLESDGKIAELSDRYFTIPIN